MMRNLPFQLLFATVLLLALSACRNHPDARAGAYALFKNTELPVQEKKLTGIYQGTIPCKDCAGLYTELSLFPDKTGRIKERHTGKNADPTLGSSTCTWHFDSGIIRLEAGDGVRGEVQYRLVEGGLLQLPAAKQSVTDSSVRLLKINTDILDRKWVLTELQGKAVEKIVDMREFPFLILSWKDDRAGGYAGCNTYGGAYALSANNSLRFSELITTLMACESMEVEFGFIEVLKNTLQYSITDNTLVLYGGGAALARFRSDE